MRSAMVLTAVLWATAAGAAEELASEAEVQARRTFVGLSVLPLGTGGAVGLEAERAVGERVSVRLGVRAGASLTSQGIDGQGTDYSSFQIAATPGVRFFLTGRAPEGLWVGPNLELSRGWMNTTSKWVNTISGESATQSSDSTRWGVGGELMLGYTLVLSRGLTAQAGVGFGGGWSSIESEGFVFPPIGATVPTSGVRALQTQLPVETQHVESWNFRERVSLAVGWAF
ncbi:DUF3575 domain-containing protein [Myxococcaceae bacterium GXIMD 01537]